MKKCFLNAHIQNCKFCVKLRFENFGNVLRLTTFHIKFVTIRDVP